jgi:hypothetical protein
MPVLTPISWFDNVGGWPVARLRKGLAEKMQKVLGAGTAQDLIYRDLEPTDILNGTVTGQLSNPNALTANTLQADQFAAPNATPATNQAFGVYGIELINPTGPHLDLITFGVGGATWGRFMLDILYGEQRAIGIIDPPLLWGPSQHMAIGLLSGPGVAAANGEIFALLGLVAELDSQKISKVPDANVGTASVAGVS